MTDSFSFYGGRAGLPPPYLKKLPTPNDEEALYVRENGLINGPLIEWGKKTSWKQGGLIPHKVAMMIKAEEKVEKKRKRAPRKTAEEFFVEAFVEKHGNRGLTEVELTACARRKWKVVSEDKTDEAVEAAMKAEAEQYKNKKGKGSKTGKTKRDGESDSEADGDDSSSDEEDEEEEKVPTPAQAPQKEDAVKRRRLRKLNESPAAKRKAPARERQPSPRKGERTPAPAAPGSAGRKSARSTGRATSIRSVRTAPINPALMAAALAAAANDNLVTPKDLIMRDGTAMADPFAFPASSEGFTASPAPPRLGVKGKKRTPPSGGPASSSPQFPARKPKKLTLDKVV